MSDSSKMEGLRSNAPLTVNGGESIPSPLIYNNEIRGQQAKTAREVVLEEFIRQFLKATMNVGDYGVAECHQRAKELGF